MYQMGHFVRFGTNFRVFCTTTLVVLAVTLQPKPENKKIRDGDG